MNLDDFVENTKKEEMWNKRKSKYCCIAPTLRQHKKKVNKIKTEERNMKGRNKTIKL